MLAVPCPACGALLARGALRCRHCNADARAASLAVPAPQVTHAAAPVPPAARGRTRPARDLTRELEELLALSRELYLGP